ncbi:cupin domain-containing protein [Prosthecochloris sp.]|uniref:cupin domain-containing protein n=1 Tax=Prosthecochloris sp. TaxID=290513 RepID=UPI0025D615CB|nr:cupin domain-containing protein [Prosthecochloris sp.]
MQKPVVRKDLLTANMDGSRPIAKVDIQEVTMEEGVKAPLHSHPCPTMGIVTEGTIAFEIEGNQTQTLRVGDAFYEPANVRIAKFNNVGNSPAKFVVFYLLGENENETIRVLKK